LIFPLDLGNASNGMADTAQPGHHPARTPDSTLVSGMTKEFT
jgi:hypothetical protein